MVQSTHNSVRGLKHFVLSLLAVAFFSQGMPIQALEQEQSAQPSSSKWQQRTTPPYLLVGMELRVNFNEKGACQLLIVNGQNEDCGKLSEFLKNGFENNGIIIFDGHSSQWLPYRIEWWR
jgi:hypothetical protein